MRYRALVLPVVVLLCVASGPFAFDAVAQRGADAPRTPRKLMLVDRSGARTLLGEVPFNTNGPRVSPDGTQLAYGVDGLYIGPLMNIAAMAKGRM